jgi:thiosulfate sulfurtransferase
MYKQLSRDEAKELLGSDDVLIADVRDDESYQQGHIDGAIHLTMTALQEFCDQNEKSNPILLYCYHGISSQSVAQHLTDQGFTEIYSLIGGFEAWVAQEAS